jgi:hypothetical protein
MSSYYLTPDASAKRLDALLNRLRGEAIDLSPFGLTWMPESDFWRLPASVQRMVIARTMSEGDLT